MKKVFHSLLLFSISALIISCEKDEGKLPNLGFKTGGSYISTDVTQVPGSSITIGITASKAESADVLKKFNISKSVNGASSSSVFDKDLTGTEGDAYNYDFVTTVDTTNGQKSKYTFTVTNRDGITNQLSLTVTTQK